MEHIKITMPDSHTSLARLKRRVAALARPVSGPARGLFALGVESVDARLGGGLARGGLHEIVALDRGDHPAATGFALMLACRASKAETPLLHVRIDHAIREAGMLYAPGLAELGIDPDRIITIQAPDELSALRVASDVAGCMSVGAMIVEAGEARKLDLTASRRLALAATQSGTTGLVLRSGASAFASAASTRWAVASAPSALLPAQAPGHPTLRAELIRHRGGVPPFLMTLEWDRDCQTFREPPLLRTLSSPAERGQMAA